MSAGKVTQIQAAKFDKIGDFNYMVYASRNKKSEVNSKKVKNQELIATMQIFAPRHSDPVYEVNLPFYQADVKEQYWIGFCLRGGQGINFNGVTVSDPAALFKTTPSVQQQCILDREHVTTIGISQPLSVNVKTLSQDQVEITWEAPAADGGAAINHYRIFVTEKDNQGSVARIETIGDKQSYKLKT